MNRLKTMNGESPRSIRACRSMLLSGVSPQKNRRRVASEKSGRRAAKLFIEILKKRDALDTILFRCQFSFRIHSGRFVIQFCDQSYRVQHEPKNARNLFIFIVYVISVIRKCVIFQEFCTPLNIKLKKRGGVLVLSVNHYLE